VYAGLAAGVAYDLLRLLRLSTRAGQVLTNLLDFVFWILTAMLVALAAALSGAQGLRFYLVLGTACGMLLWAAGLRRIMLGTARFASNAVQKALRIPPKEGRENRKQAGKKAEKGE